MRRLLVSVAFLAFAAAPAMAAQTAESKACSDQATAKGLKGKERESFRADCLKAAAPAAAPKAAAAPKSVAAPKAAAPAMAAAAPKSDLSKSCSDQATAKGLHGKDRETFRDGCMKGSAPAMAAAKPVAAPMAATPAKATAAPVMAAAKPAGFAPKSAQSQACSDQATAKGLHGKDRETFRDSCMKGTAASAKPMADPAMAETVPPEPGKAVAASASGKPRTANQLASDQRIKRCGAMWQTDKAAGRTVGQTWPKYWSACSARLKAAAA